MELSFEKINGTNKSLNYDRLKETLIEKISPTCRKAEIYIFNNFPVAVSSFYNADIIIILRIIDIDQNYYRINQGDDRVYIKNLIIAVSILKGYENSPVSINHETITFDDQLTDFSQEANKLKWGLTNYLTNSCNMIRTELTVHPIIWLENKHSNKIGRNLVVSNELNFNNIMECVLLNKNLKYAGYKSWIKLGDDLFQNDLQNIIEQASKDSELGFITKKKIERFQSKFDPASQKAYNKIGGKLVIVKGKAGTGKSSDILKWMLQLSLKGKKAKFLTYNNLLVFDISTQIRSFNNSLSEDQRYTRQPTTVSTLHSFFFQIAKKLGVLLILSASRIEKLSTTLDIRLKKLNNFLNEKRNERTDPSLAWLKFKIQNNLDIDEGTKREGIEFIKFYKKEKFLGDSLKTQKWLKDFKKYKLNALSSNYSQKIFLTDYHNVLKRILDILQEPGVYIDKYKVLEKFELLETVMRLQENLLEKGEKNLMNKEKFEKRLNKSISGFRAKRLLFIDEAQDCHPLERDILYAIFHPENLIIANGGKEQLIRYSTLCDWKTSRNSIIEDYTYSKKSKSFRMKPAMAALANFIAKSYNIDLNIEPLDTEDHGSVIIDFSNNNDENTINNIKKLNEKGERFGCSAYESLLILRNAHNNNNNNNQHSLVEESNHNITINEHDNIRVDKSIVRTKWSVLMHPKILELNFNIWDGSSVNKKQLSIPGSLSARSIFYESCRGIEAWSIMCLGLDNFYEEKKKEPEADNYLLNEIFFDPKERNETYAATWILMAITRAIDTCYIQIDNKSSKLSQIIIEFSKIHPNFIEIIN